MLAGVCWLVSPGTMMSVVLELFYFANAKSLYLYLAKLSGQLYTLIFHKHIFK